jgi:TonB family protein
MMMDEKGMDQIERHEQSVKRVRLLCDMHRVPCGDVKDLDELIVTIREDRHFAMDFWALVGDLSARERGTLSDEEMLEVIVEASAGLRVSSVPHGQRAKVQQLRQLLAGVDVGRPADLPDAISPPEDALLAVYRDRDKPSFTKPGVPVVVLPDRVAGTMRTSARVRLTGTDDTWVARRSIGEALSRLERTSTELREQLAAIDEQLVEQKAEPVIVEQPEAVASEMAAITPEMAATKPQAEAIVPEAKKIAPEPQEIVVDEPRQIEHRKLVPEPRAHVREQKPPSVEAAEAIAAREILMRALENRKEPQDIVAEPANSDWRRQAAPVDTRTDAEILRARKIEHPQTESKQAQQKETEREAEVFAPRPVHTLSQRGLATPRKDDGPSNSVPLSRYAREESRRSGRGAAVAAVLLMMLALAGAGTFYLLRTESGHEAMARMGPALREQYDGFVARLSALKREAGGSSAATTSESDPVVKPAPEATTVVTPPATANGSASLTTNHAPPVPAPIQQAAPIERTAPPAQATNGLPTPSEPPITPATPTVAKAGNATASEPAARKEQEAAAVHSRSIEPLKEPAGEGLVSDANTVRVPASVMEANLVTSRVPAYPEAAKAEGIQGPVVMETVISKSGTVDHVRVIEGDHQLRSAAEEAVLKWRFRPYVLNGQPVDVVTMVRVDFRLGSGSSR